MKVREIMTPRPVAVGTDEPVAAAARLLSRHNVGALPVTAQGGRLVGMLTDRDIAVRCVAANFDPNITRVRTVMSSGPVTVPAEESGEKAARTMGRHRVQRLPVTENGRLVGMLSRGDFAAYADRSGEAARALRTSFGSEDGAE